MRGNALGGWGRGSGGWRGTGDRKAYLLPMTAPATKAKKKITADVAWREARELLWLHRKRLAVGLVLMLLSRASSFVLPMSTKYVIDTVLPSGNAD